MNLAKRLLVFASLLLVCATASWGQTITSASTASGTVNLLFSYQITASFTPSSFTVTGVLPAGLSLTDNGSSSGIGVISGLPTAPSTNVVTVTAINQNGVSPTLTLTITISAAIPTPVITSTLSTNGTVGKPFSYQITASNSPTSYSAAPLPLGLTNDTAGGVISGTPQVEGTTYVTLTAANASGTGPAATLTLNILSSSLLLATNLIFSEGFESNFPDAWQVGDANKSGTTSYWATVTSPFGGVTAPEGNRMAYCAGVGYGGSSTNPVYQNNMAAYMQQTFDLSGCSAVALSFRSLIPSMETVFKTDSCNVLVSTNAGAKWVNVWKVSRVDTGWTSETIDLSAYAGNPSVTLRFEFDSDESKTGMGWFLDDIAVFIGQGDRFDNATVILPGTNYSGNVEAPNEFDVRRVTLRQGYTYVITATPGTLKDPKMWLFDPNRIQLAYNDDASGLGLGSRITYTCTNAAAGDYFIQVGGVSRSTGGYTLLVTEKPVYADIQAVSVTMLLSTNGDPRGQNPIALDYELQNNGPFDMNNGEAYDYEGDIYLSKSGSSAGTGVLIGSETIQLPRNNTGSLTATAYTIPFSLSAGKYDVWLHVTPLSGSPTDLNSANNWVVSTNTITLPPPSTVTIAGIVSKSGSRLSGVLITQVSDDGSTTNTITDFFGYRLAVTTLVATNGWSGTITPSTTDGTAGGFVPPVRTYAHVTSNLVAQDFTWIPPPIISGKVTRGGASTGVASVTLVLSNGSLTVETMTDAQGNYSITLPRGWTGTVTTVTPSTNGLTGAFAPTYLAYTNICANRTAQNFSYGALPVVKGKVTKAGTTNGVGGVTITFSNNVSTITITTDGNGSYSNTVPYRWSGKATASFTSGGFAMPTITYSALTANQTGKDYIWTPAPMISGKVTKSGTSAVVTNIVITFVGNGTTNTATTDGKGTYSNVVVYGWTGTVTPSNVAGCGFSPVSKSYSKLTANSAGQNFTWLPPPIISGKVTQSGTGMTGVTITASNGGGTNTTGVGGTYSLAVPYNWTGVVTCASTRVGTFSPTSKSFKTKVTANQTQNFTWTASPAPHAVSPSVSATIVLPRQLLHATGRVRWTGADAVQVRQSPELLTIALVDGVVAAEPAVPVVAPGDLTTALEFADGLAGIVGTANCKLVVVRNVNGQPMTDATLTDTSVIDTVLFLTPGHDAILSWDLLLLRP